MKEKSVYLLAMLVIGAVAIASIASEQAQYNSLTTKYNDLSSQYRDLSAKYNNATAMTSHLRSQLNQNVVMYHDLLENYTKTRIVFQRPATNESIDIWTLSQKVSPHSWVFWESLDTFDNHVRLTTNATATVFILDLDNYVNFTQGRPYSPIYNSTGTSFSYDLVETEGCGGYVLVIQNNSSNAILITPDISATFAPTPFLTGICAG